MEEFEPEQQPNSESEELGVEQKQEAPVDKLVYLSQKEIDAILKEAKARGGEGKPVFNDLREEIITRASIYKLLNDQCIEVQNKIYDIEHKSPNIRQFSGDFERTKKEEIEILRERHLNGEKLRHQDGEELLLVLSKEDASEEDCRLVLDYGDQMSIGAYETTRWVALDGQIRNAPLEFENCDLPVTFKAQKAAIRKMSEKIDNINTFRTTDYQSVINIISLFANPQKWLEDRRQLITEEQRELIKKEAIAKLADLVERKGGEGDLIREKAFYEMYQIALKDTDVKKQIVELIKKGEEGGISDFAKGIFNLNSYQGRYGYSTFYSPSAMEMLSALTNKADELSPKIKEYFVLSGHDPLFEEIKKIRDYHTKSGNLKDEKNRSDFESAKLIIKADRPEEFWDLMKKYTPQNPEDLATSESLNF